MNCRMAEIEFYPINTRVVCLNQPHLRPMWVFKALADQLGCYYNHHLLQVISMPAKIQLPNAKTVKFKGHASHNLPTEAVTLNTTLQTGTYIMFYIPDSVINTVQTSHLILNGIESITKEENPSEAVIKIVSEGVTQEITSDTKKKLNLSTLNVSNNDNQKSDIQLDTDNVLATANDMTTCLELHFNFKNCEIVETLLEEEENIDSGDDSDCSEDLHKVIRNRLRIDISSLLGQWKHLSNDKICVFLIKPGHQYQSWQFKSAWISSVFHCDKENLGSEAAFRKTNITRKKPVSSPDCYSTLNIKRKTNKQYHKETNNLIDIKTDSNISVF